MVLRPQSISNWAKSCYRSFIEKYHFSKRSLERKLVNVIQSKNLLHRFPSKIFSIQITRRIQYVIAIGIVLIVMGAAVHFVRQIYALTLYFTQSDWSGGADTEATINSSNASGWTKFHSASSGMDTSTTGEIKLKIEISQP